MMTTNSQNKIAALVPMRNHSERVPGKNYRLFAGKPLFHRVLETLSSCKAIDSIAVDTDSLDIKEGIAAHFPNIRVIDRPEHLKDGGFP